MMDATGITTPQLLDAIETAGAAQAYCARAKQPSRRARQAIKRALGRPLTREESRAFARGWTRGLGAIP